MNRSVPIGLLLASLLGGPAPVSARPEAAVQAHQPRRGAEASSAKRWVSMVVTRITRAGGTSDARNSEGTVTVRVRIGADGTMESATVDESSGSPALDERALRAVRAASPFAPPPAALLTLDGYTELSFPVDFQPPTHR